jgi:hypothetical protein
MYPSGATWPSGVGNVRMVTVSGPTRLPGACEVRAWTVSPAAGANAAMYTSALTVRVARGGVRHHEAAVRVPGGTIGPPIWLSALLRYAASRRTPRSGVAGAKTG